MSWAASEYGDAWAAVYDELFADLPETAAAVAALTRLASGGRVLEFGIGTGRLALPLARQGLEVHGIDASQAMVGRLRAKPGGAEIPVVIGDFADTRAGGRFDLVVLAFNTLFSLPTQQAQCRCFANAAAHLADGGRFVVEAFIPDLSRFDRHQTVDAEDVAEHHVILRIARHDPVAQRITSARVVIDQQTGVRTLPIKLRYAWPSEIDLMAALAGLQLTDRWANWSADPFAPDSTSHISIYRQRAHVLRQTPAVEEPPR